MEKSKISKRVDFTYFIGAGISLISFNITIFFHKESGLPMIFSLVCLFTYAGVLIRGIFDRGTWGKTQRQMKISAFVGYTSAFIIFSVESVLLLTQSFELSKNVISNSLIYGGVGIVLLYIFLYTYWFRKIIYRELGDS